MMQQLRERWKTLVLKELERYANEKGVESKAWEKGGPFLVEKPPREELGDIAFPLFAFAKIFRQSPDSLARLLEERLSASNELPDGTLSATGPYLNVKIDTASLARSLAKKIAEEKDSYGWGNSLSGKRIMVEFSCPNTNKPLHLGHLRNDAIGESIAAILKANGAAVRKVNLINNRGIHICKSMIAYQQYGNGETPQSSGMKGDHFVGKYYVLFSQWEKTDPTANEQAQQMLQKWEQNDPEVRALWHMMNTWALDGIKETYRRTQVSFDQYYFESDTYTLGRDIVLEGLQKGIFYQEEDGSVWVDLSDIQLDKKVLLRKDGTSLYLTQDIGTALARAEDWPFDRLIYVVASEQTYHFKVLFHVLEKLGYPWAKNLYHLAYGMVNLPEGKMKSREGTIVDADDLLEQLTSLAQEEIRNKEREEEVGDVRKTAQAIALGALNYYLLQVNPNKDMVFNPAESISFNGNTGPYLQYMGARICSMLRRYEKVRHTYDNIPFNASLLSMSQEEQLIKLLADFDQVVEQAGRELDPSIIAGYLYELSRLFSRYYHDTPVLKAPSPEVVKARVTLVSLVLQVLQNAYALLGIPFLESM